MADKTSILYVGFIGQTIKLNTTMDINYKPKVEGWLETKKEYRLLNISKILLTTALMAFVIFTFSLYAKFTELTTLTLVILYPCFALGFYFYLQNINGTNITSKPHLEVEFLQTGKMKYYIVCGKSKEELRINGKLVDFLTEDEVHEVKQELHRRWLACEQEALQRAYEEGYKSKSKVL